MKGSFDPQRGSQFRSRTAVLEIGTILVVQVSARAYDGPHTIFKNKREKDSKIFHRKLNSTEK